MAVFKVETKNKVDIDKKPRVYFTCHPEDFEKHFKKICDDIFKTHDCAIYYTEDMSEVIAEDEKRVDLGRNNLFVIPVTFKLLTTHNRAMDEDIPYALKEHIPVLPIVMDPGIDEFYSRPDNFGELQYLNPCSTDLTEISYEEKLKKFLESVLISDDLAMRVRAAFDAYIFLSYRKKDRKYANELMRLIHGNPECRDIAIWFDEFLTPGESFKENIESAIDISKAFLLLTTPHVFEKNIDKNGDEHENYIISTELPLAQKKRDEKGTELFAVIIGAITIDLLSSLMADDYIDINDSISYSRLITAVSKLTSSKNDNDPEHSFLIGLAYLYGIDTEVDFNRAFTLMELSASQDYVSAFRMLSFMYQTGLGVEQSHEKYLFWKKRELESYKTRCKEKIIANYRDYLKEVIDCSNYCSSVDDYNTTIEICQEAISIMQTRTSKNVLIFQLMLLPIYNILVEAYIAIGDWNPAQIFGKKANRILSSKRTRSTIGEEYHTLLFQNEILLGDLYCNQYLLFFCLDDFHKAINHYNRSVKVLINIYQKSKDLMTLYKLSYLYGKMASLYKGKGDYLKSKDCLKKGIAINKGLAAKTADNIPHINLIDLYNLMGSILEKEGNLIDATAFHEKALDKCCYLLNSANSVNIQVLISLAKTYAFLSFSSVHTSIKIRCLEHALTIWDTISKTYPWSSRFKLMYLYTEIELENLKAKLE